MKTATATPLDVVHEKYWALLGLLRPRLEEGLLIAFSGRSRQCISDMGGGAGTASIGRTSHGIDDVERELFAGGESVKSASFAFLPTKK